MCCLKKLLCTLLLLSSFVVPVFSQVQQSQSTDLWNSIDWNLNWLENEQLYSQTRLIELEKKLENSEQALIDKELVLQDLESSLQKSEQDTKRWKNCCLVLGCTTLTLLGTTTVMILTRTDK